MSGGIPNYSINSFNQSIGGLPNGLLRQSLAQNNSFSRLGGQLLQTYPQLITPRAARMLLGLDQRPVEEPPKHEEFIIGELTAHRCWRVHDDEFLTSISADEIWAPDEPMTTKNGVSGVEGQGKGDIGIHAFNAQRHALKFAKDWGRGTPIVWGKIHLWGDIVEHELGYRAEYARITSIDGVLGKRWFNKNRCLNKLRTNYHCEEVSNAA